MDSDANSVYTPAALALAKPSSWRSRQTKRLVPVAHRGTRLTQMARRAGWESRMARADAKATDYVPVIGELQAAGTTSLRGIAAELNNRSIPTATGTGTPIKQIVQPAIGALQP